MKFHGFTDQGRSKSEEAALPGEVGLGRTRCVRMVCTWVRGALTTCHPHAGVLGGVPWVVRVGIRMGFEGMCWRAYERGFVGGLQLVGSHGPS